MTNETLREICINNDWFASGTNSQYDKLFDMNERNCSVDELVLMIWLCSNEISREQIKQELAKHTADSKPEIIKDMGTNMSEADYQKLRDDGRWEISEAEAKMLINEEFGFEVSRIQILYDVVVFIKDGRYAKAHQRLKRKPQNCSTDYNYVRFDVDNRQYEMVNGELMFYYN